MSWSQTIFNWLGKLRKPDGTLGEMLATADGYLRVTVEKVVAAATTWVDPQAGTPLTYRRQLASTPKTLHHIAGANEGSVDRWFMVFDRSATPTNGNEPVMAFKVPAGQPFSWSPPGGRAFAVGIWWDVSSTAGTLTEDTAATFRVHAKVE